jgi:hypothetical protein
MGITMTRAASLKDPVALLESSPGIDAVALVEEVLRETDLSAMRPKSGSPDRVDWIISTNDGNVNINVGRSEKSNASLITIWMSPTIASRACGDILIEQLCAKGARLMSRPSEAR